MIRRDADGLEDSDAARAARAALTWEPKTGRSPTPEELRDFGAVVERFGTPIAELRREPSPAAAEPCACAQADCLECSPRPAPVEDLPARSNGYEVVAATSEEHALEVLRGLDWVEKGEEEGDGLEQLPDTAPMRDEDGTLSGETVGDLVRREGKPGHLWSIDQ